MQGKKLSDKEAEQAMPAQPLDLRQLKPSEPDRLDHGAPSAIDQTNVLQSSYGNSVIAHTLILRKSNAAGHSEMTNVAARATASPTAVPGTTLRPALIVEDDAETIGPGQMRRTAFLSQLRAAVSSTTAEALAGTTWSAAASPFIDRWFARYSAQNGQEIERATRRYAPEAAPVTNASDLMSVVIGRVRRSLTTLVTTGQMPSVPENMPMGLPGAGGAETGGGAVSAAASGIASAASGLVSGVGSAISAIGSILFKSREGGAEVGDPQAIQSRLGAGQSLDGGVRSRMEAAFGESFGGVQVHTDANAGELSSNLNARAFTVGQHIAFGAGEYQPGTLIGDALVAHELAHVMQQREGVATHGPARKGASEPGALEDDADQAAVGAVVSTLGGKRGLTRIATKALPSLRAGLRLQRCSAEEKPLAPIPPPKRGQTYEEWLKTFPGFTQDRDIASAAPAELQGWIVGKLGVSPDCADVSMALRHYYLTSQGKTHTFKAGPKKKEFKIGYGVSDEDLKTAMVDIGSVNFQEDRKGFRQVKFYKKNGAMIRNLKQLIKAGLKPGDLMVWQKKSGAGGVALGHVQTVQEIDVNKHLLTLVQGNMDGDQGKGELQQWQRTFMQRTGVEDGDADILDAGHNAFYGAGPWVE